MALCPSRVSAYFDTPRVPQLVVFNVVLFVVIFEFCCCEYRGVAGRVDSRDVALERFCRLVKGVVIYGFSGVAQAIDVIATMFVAVGVGCESSS
ncbi:MAG: hypothetical protein J3Q66DRAFT_361392 [Benniella sp.]|nr:MAG: hypothetical protein J3Q66DRAFT_361392 [Benniella sp.]